MRSSRYPPRTFGAEHPREPRGVLLEQARVLEHTGAVHDPAQWRTLAANPRQHSGQTGLVGDVERLHDNRRSASAQLIDDGCRFLGQTTPADEHETAGAAFSQPLRHGKPETGESARHEVRAVTPDRRIGGRAMPHDDLAGVARLRHELEGPLDLIY